MATRHTTPTLTTHTGELPMAHTDKSVSENIAKRNLDTFTRQSDLLSQKNIYSLLSYLNAELQWTLSETQYARILDVAISMYVNTGDL
jgi:hypothetical protein